MDLDDMTSSIGIPKKLLNGMDPQASAALSSQRPTKSPGGGGGRSQGNAGGGADARVLELRRCLKESMEDLVSALERDLEPYKQPGMQNLVTGEDLDPRATEAERLAILSQSYSQPVTSREVRSFCV